MILVKRQPEESTQKVVSNFLKRVKRSNLVARKRKTQHFTKHISKLMQHKKAVRREKYLENIVHGGKLSKR
jgi:hypothetical protein